MMNMNMNMNNNLQFMNMNMNNMNNMDMMNMNKINIMNNMNMMNNMMLNQANQNIMPSAIIRLQKEFYLCSIDAELKGLGCVFQMENNNYFIWRVTLKGPSETPYEGGIFTIRIIFPPNYPNKGPEFRFLNHVYHLNVDFIDQNNFA